MACGLFLPLTGAETLTSSRAEKPNLLKSLGIDRGFFCPLILSVIHICYTTISTATFRLIHRGIG